MTVVTIKTINRKTSITRETAKKAAEIVMAKIGAPKTLVVRVKKMDGPKQSRTARKKVK